MPKLSLFLAIFLVGLNAAGRNEVAASPLEDSKNDGVYDCNGNAVCWKVHKYMLCNGSPGKCELPPPCPDDGKCSESTCEGGFCIQDALYTKDESVNENDKLNAPCNGDGHCEAQFCDLSEVKEIELDGVKYKGECKNTALCRDDSECAAGLKCKYSECYNP